MNETGASDETTKTAPVLVFISYAWEDDDYKLLIKRLAARLRKNGVDARLDAWRQEGLTIPDFMSHEIRHADKILVVCSPQYRRKVHAMEDGERISGVGWESMLVTSRLWADVDQRNKIVAVLLRGTWKKAASDFIVGLPYFDLSNMAQFEANYQGLLQSLTSQRKQAPPLGPLPKIAPEPIEPLRGPSKEQLSRINSLPSFSTSFAGRESDIAKCTGTLSEHRWITLTGMGGIGKTRLAVAVGRRLSDAFDDGVLFVELAYTSNSEQEVLSAVVAALNENGLEVKDDSEKALTAALRSRNLLLILDNFRSCHGRRVGACQDTSTVPALEAAGHIAEGAGHVLGG
jgi:hypothetical protein